MPVVTILLLAGMLSVWLIAQGGGLNLTNLAFSICNLGLVPAELTGGLPLGSSIPLTRDFVCVVGRPCGRAGTGAAGGAAAAGGGGHRRL